MENHSLMAKLESTVAKKVELAENQPLRYLARAIFATVLLTFATTIAFLLAEHLQNFLLIFTGTGSAEADIVYNISKILFAGIFPWALVLILFMNTELFTSNAMYFTAMLIQKKTTVKATARVWILCYVGNLIGAILTAAILVYSQTFTADVSTFAAHVVEAKLIKVPMILFAQAIIANVLVNIAVIINLNLKDDSAKISAILFVIFIFAFFGSEHVIANFSSFSLVGMATNFANMSAGAIAQNVIFATLGNIAGGAIIGALYSWLNIGKNKYTD